MGAQGARVKRQLGFQCPSKNAAGSPLRTEGPVKSRGENSTGQALVGCIYEAEGDPCLYSSDGSLQLGPSTCFSASFPATCFPTGFPTFCTFTFTSTSTTSLFSSLTSASSRKSSTSTSLTHATTSNIRSGASSTTSSVTSSSSSNLSAEMEPTQTAASSSRSPLAVGSAGFIGVMVAVGVVLLVVVLALCAILFDRSISRNRSQRVPRTSTVLTPNDPEMSYAASATQHHTPAGSQHSSENASSTVRPTAGNTSTIEQPAPGPSAALTPNDLEPSYAALEPEYHAPARSPHSSDDAASTVRPEPRDTRGIKHMESYSLPIVSASPGFATATFPAANSHPQNDSDFLESHSVASTVAPYTSGGSMFPAPSSRMRNDSGVQELHFLADSLPPDWARQASMRPQWTPPLRPICELPPNSEPDGTTTYGNSRSSAADSDVTPRQGRRSRYQHGQGAAQSQNQEWQRHMRLWSSSVASENRQSTSDRDSTA